jgi:gas vesicle protein
MAQDYGNGGSGSGIAFGVGLLAGVVIGAGLGMLLAPKDGAALRRDIARRARDLQDDAAERLERATGVVDDLTAKGRDVAQRARTAVATGVREARRHASTIGDALDNLDSPESGHRS